MCAYLVAQSYLTLRFFGLWPARLLSPWVSPGKNTGVGYHTFLQEIFLTQESNPLFLGLLHCRQNFLPTALLGKPQSYHMILQFHS